MLISQREKHIQFLESALEQFDNLKYNIKTLTGIIDILIKDVMFPKQNKLLIELKAKLNKKKINYKELKKLINEIKTANE